MTSEHDAWRYGDTPIKPLARVKFNGSNCSVHGHHAEAVPLYVLDYYIFPQALQIKAFGEVQDTRRALICPNGYDRVMKYVYELIEVHLDGTKPLEPEVSPFWPADYQLAHKGARRYIAAMNRLADLRSKGPWSVHPNDWRCPTCGGGLLLNSAGGRQTWIHTCQGRSITSDVKEG